MLHLLGLFLMVSCAKQKEEERKRRKGNMFFFMSAGVDKW
jgi:hypothetical protein